MRFETVITRLKAFGVPADWKGTLFLLPEAMMEDLYALVRDRSLRSCIELGTGFGATACVMAAAIEENGGGCLTTVDRYLHQPVNVEVLAGHVGLKKDSLRVIAHELGYNWYLGDLIQEQSRGGGRLEPLFDFCFLDGAHEWEADALAFFLVASLLKPGAWVALDDIDFCLRSMATWQRTHGNRTSKELDTRQVEMVFDLAVRPHPEFGEFRLSHGGRMGWARKTEALNPRDHDLLAALPRSRGWRLLVAYWDLRKKLRGSHSRGD